MPLIKFETGDLLEPPKGKILDSFTTTKELPKAQSIEAHIGFILDESSSMTSVWQDTISGFNSYISQLRDEIPEAKITFATFVADQFKLRGNDKPIDEILPLNTTTYTPYGQTPLVDSVMQLIILIEQKVNVNPQLKPVIVIQTDGSENSSTNFTMENLKKVVDKKREEGWRFILITCGIDSNKLAYEMGIDPSTAVEYGRGKTLVAFKIVAQITARSAKSGEEAVFSLEDKRSLR